MQIIKRSSLSEFLTGPNMDPEAEFAEEMTAIAAAILADCSAEFFVHSDHENGEDPEVGWPEHAAVASEDLIPLTYNTAGDSYYGVSAERLEHFPGAAVYQCYVGGSPLNSAPGFVICPATLGE